MCLFHLRQTGRKFSFDMKVIFGLSFRGLGEEGEFS